jgi:hypothetical protein
LLSGPDVTLCITAPQVAALVVAGLVTDGQLRAAGLAG